MKKGIIEELKSKILANLEFLPDKINFNTCDNQFVRLLSVFYDTPTITEYVLCLHILVKMKDYRIESFSIEEIYFFKNLDEKPSFEFTKTELNDYIDF